MDNTVLDALMTLDMFVQRYDQDGPFEIIDGVMIPNMANVAGHGDVADNLVWSLNLYIRPTKAGKTYIETPYVLVYNSQWVKGARIPDVMYFQLDKLNAYYEAEPDWRSKPLLIVPDLAVEIVSPNDKFTEVTLKVKRYLEDGVQLVWVIDPFTREVMVYQPGSRQAAILSGQDVLTGGDVLPGFEMQVAALFSPNPLPE